MRGAVDLPWWPGTRKGRDGVEKRGSDSRGEGKGVPGMGGGERWGGGGRVGCERRGEGGVRDG